MGYNWTYGNELQDLDRAGFRSKLDNRLKGKGENLVSAPVPTTYASKRVTSCEDLQHLVMKNANLGHSDESRLSPLCAPGVEVVRENQRQ